MIAEALRWVQLLEPLHGNGYQFWSGIGSDFGEVFLVGAAWTLIRKHNCHVKGCPSIVTHLDPHVHAPACRRHHSYRHRRGVAAPAEKGASQ